MRPSTERDVVGREAGLDYVSSGNISCFPELNPE